MPGISHDEGLAGSLMTCVGGLSLPTGSHESPHPCVRVVPLLEQSGRGNLVPLRRDEGRGARLNKKSTGVLAGKAPPPGRTNHRPGSPARSLALAPAGAPISYDDGQSVHGPYVRMSHRLFERFALRGERSDDFLSSAHFLARFRATRHARNLAWQEPGGVIEALAFVWLADEASGFAQIAVCPHVSGTREKPAIIRPSPRRRPPESGSGAGASHAAAPRAGRSG